MFDIHKVPANWGLIRTIFGIPAYSLFVGLGILIGILYYFSDTKRKGQNSADAVIIVASGIIFGAIGAKLPLLIANYKLIGVTNNIWFEGKTIVGGLLGGFLGVIAVKKICNIKVRMGNYLAPAIALGMSIGRFGCLFNGCCYGKAAGWGIDFGDGLLRYPTQIFEIIFHFVAFLLMVKFKDRVKTPGVLFKVYIVSYLVFRFFTEFIRQGQILVWGMTLYQVLCLSGLLVIIPKVIKHRREYSLNVGVTKEE